MTRHAALPVLAWLAALAGAAALAASARYTADLSAFLPRTPSAAQQLLVDQLREGAVGRLLLVAIEGGDVAERTALSRALATRLRADSRLSYVANGAAESVERDGRLVVDYRYLLSPAVAPARFTARGLHDAIADTVDLVASSAGGIAQALLARDPTGEVAALAEARLSEGPRPSVEGGVWVSRDGARALLLARTAAAGSDTDAQEAAQRAVRRAFADAASQLHATGAELRLTGAGVFAVESRNTIHREVRRVALLGVALVSLLLLAAYRSPLALALGLLPVLTGAAAGLAAVAAGFGVVHGITLGFGTTLIGEAVDYAIYLFVQTRVEDARETGPEGRAAWLAAFWPTIRLGVLTSMTGFAALLFSGFPGLAQLGLYSVCGLAAAALFTRYVLPSLMPAGLRVRDLAALGIRLERAIVFAGRWRGVVPVLALVAALPLVAQRDGLWAKDLSGLSSITDADQAFDGRLRADLGAPDARYVVVADGHDEQDALRAAERAGAVLQGLVARGVISGFDSPARYLPSDQTQESRAASLPDPGELRVRLAAALHGLPLRASRLEPFVADVARVRAGLRLHHADLEGTGLGVAVDSMLLRHTQGFQALLPLRAPSGANQSAVLDPDVVREALAGTSAQFLDLKAEANSLYEGYLREAIWLSLAGMAAVLLLLMLALRSARRVGRVAAPLGAAVLVTAAVLWATGQPLNLLHLVGFLLVVAVGSNYALFFERGATQGRPAPRVLASLALANVTTVIGFGVLATSSVPVLRAVGGTVALGTLLALVFAALLSASRADAG
ncbi:MAG: MMPL family transporter [Burkholderiales bacterium]